MTKTASKPARKAKAPAKTAKTPTKTTKTKSEKSTAPAVRPSTKTHIRITLLQRPDGATAEELMAAAGWQKHSVQGFIAGTVKKKMGFAVLSEKQEGGPRRYRILKDGE